MATAVEAGRALARKPTVPVELSIVFPVYNEATNVEPLYEQARDAVTRTGLSYEMIFVDNGSTDGSLEVIKRLAWEDPAVQHLSLSRNFPQQAAVFAGLCYASGRAVITMDADLQHPPALIPALVEQWRRGYEVVYTTKRSYQIPALRKLQTRLFYWILFRLSGLRLTFGMSDFRLLDRRVVDVLVRMPSYQKFLIGMVQWVGFRQVGVEYDAGVRHSGESKFSYRALVAYAVNGLVSFSQVPLRWCAGVGMGLAALAVLYGAGLVGLGLLERCGVGVHLPPGWLSLTVAITWLGGVQLLSIGAVGTYVGSLFEQSQRRPVFIVRERSAVFDPTMKAI